MIRNFSEYPDSSKFPRIFPHVIDAMDRTGPYKNLPLPWVATDARADRARRVQEAFPQAVHGIDQIYNRVEGGVGKFAVVLVRSVATASSFNNPRRSWAYVPNQMGSENYTPHVEWAKLAHDSVTVAAGDYRNGSVVVGAHISRPTLGVERKIREAEQAKNCVRIPLALIGGEMTIYSGGNATLESVPAVELFVGDIDQIDTWSTSSPLIEDNAALYGVVSSIRETVDR